METSSRKSRHAKARAVCRARSRRAVVTWLVCGLGVTGVVWSGLSQPGVGDAKRTPVAKQERKAAQKAERREPVQTKTDAVVIETTEELPDGRETKSAVEPQPEYVPVTPPQLAAEDSQVADQGAPTAAKGADLLIKQARNTEGTAAVPTTPKPYHRADGGNAGSGCAQGPSGASGRGKEEVVIRGGNVRRPVCGYALTWSRRSGCGNLLATYTFTSGCGSSSSNGSGCGPTEEETGNRVVEPGEVAKKALYPHTRDEIDARVKELLNTQPGGLADSAQQKAINLANVYRFLCGVNTVLRYDATYGLQAEQAAAACAMAGTLSHNLGSYTNVCNLAYGCSNRERTVQMYMDDPGDNNRSARGHRNWVLSPAAAKTAFGLHGMYSAMRVVDYSSEEVTKQSYSYPGHGYYPVRYMHGNGWSYYMPYGKVLSDAVKVEMWSLTSALQNERPDDEQLSEENKVEISRVYPNGEWVVFEPDCKPQKNGMFWVKVTDSDRYQDEYIVHFY